MELKFLSKTHILILIAIGFVIIGVTAFKFAKFELSNFLFLLAGAFFGVGIYKLKEKENE